MSDTPSFPVASRGLYLSGFASALGEPRPIARVRELEEDSSLRETFAVLGLEEYRHAESTPAQLAGRCLAETLDRAGVPPAEIDVVVYATTSFWRESFYRREEISRLLWEAGLTRAYPLGLTFSECGNVQGALRVAASLVAGGDASLVLVVATDCVAPGVTRIVPPKIGIKSDGAASVVVSRRPGPFEYLGTRQVINASLWELDPHADPARYLREIGAGVKQAIEGLLAEQGVRRDEIAAIVTNNYNLSVLRTVASMVGVPAGRLYAANIARVAHAVACDNLVNVETALDQGVWSEGQVVLVVGTGPNVWGATLLRRTGHPSAAGGPA